MGVCVMFRIFNGGKTIGQTGYFGVGYHDLFRRDLGKTTMFSSCIGVVSSYLTDPVLFGVGHARFTRTIYERGRFFATFVYCRGLEPVRRKHRGGVGHVFTRKGKVTFLGHRLFGQQQCVGGLERRYGNFYVTSGGDQKVFFHGVLSVYDVVQLRVKGRGVVQLPTTRHNFGVYGPFIYFSYIRDVRGHGFFIRGGV